MRFDAGDLIEGGRFEYKGIGYRIRHYGGLDAEAIVLVVELGEFAWDSGAFACRRLLEHNLRVPAGRIGYYALASQSDMVLYCLRIDVTGEEPHLMIAAAVETLSTAMEGMTREISFLFGEIERDLTSSGESFA